MNINELLAQIDNLKRGMSRNALSLMQNPVEHMQNSLGRWAGENLPTREDVQDAQSVMPGMGDTFSNKLALLAMNGIGRVGGTTVQNAQRIAYPEIYGNPRALVAAPRIAPENPLMQRLFGVNRDDLWEISEHGRRQGNQPGIPFRTAANPQGNAAAQNVMTPRNEMRLLDFIAESERRPELHRPMASWYVMDPVFRRMEELFGKEEAIQRYQKFNSLTGMASP